MNNPSKVVRRSPLNRLHCLILVICIPLFFACSNKKGILFRTSDGVGVSSTFPDSSFVKNQNFLPIIQPGDRITVTNLNNESLINGLGVSTPLKISYEVDETGKIKLPGVGEVTIAGLKIREAEQLITEAYKQSILVDPLFVIEIVSSKVTLLGEFFKQGNFPLMNKETSLIDVVGDAGGFTARADKTKIKILRGDKANPEIIDVDLTNLSSLKSQKLNLQNHDIIYVQPRGIYLFVDKLSPVLTYVGVGTSLISLIYLFTNSR